MSWSRFAKILHTQPLESEIKLMMINILSGITDPKQEEEFFTFLFAWEEAQASTQKKLMDGIRDLTNEYQQAKNQLCQQELP